MALTPLSPSDIQGVYVTFFNRPADPLGLAFWSDPANANTETGIKPLMDLFATSAEYSAIYNSGMSPYAIVDMVYMNLFGRHAEPAGLNFWAPGLQNGDYTVSDIAYQVSQGALTTDLTAFQNKTTAAVNFTNALDTGPEMIAYDGAAALAAGSAYLATVTDDASLLTATTGLDATIADMVAGSAPAGDTFTLTTSADHFTGGAGVDYFDGSLSSGGQQTLGNSDTLVGGTGTDTLSATISGTGTYAPTLTGIDSVSATFTAAGTLSLLNSTGITSLAAVNSTGGTATFTNIASLDGLTLKVTDTNQSASFGFTSAAVAGDTDSVTLELANVTGGTVTANGIETINVVSITDANTLTNLASDATTLNITGDQDLTLGLGGSADVDTINAADFTGVLTATGQSATGNTITGGSGNDALAGAAGNDVISGGADADTITSGTGNDSLSGGAGNDTFTMTTSLTGSDTVTGGDDTDTLSITAEATAGQTANVTEIETLTTSAATQDLSVFTATTLTRVNTSATAGASTAFTMASANVATLGISGATPGTVSLARATDTLADSLAVSLSNTAGVAISGSLTLNDEETVSIASGGSAANTVADFNATDLTSLTITGAQNLTLTGNIGALKLATINSSTATGAVSVNDSSSTVDLTATAGSGKTTIVSGSGNDILTGGAGNDSLDGSAGNNSITGGAGDDTLTGGTGNDTILGGVGNDSITGGTGNDSLSGGDGNDTFTFAAGEFTSADFVDGGEGTDTLTIAGSVSATPAVTSIEIINATLTGGTLTVSGATTLSKVVVADGSGTTGVAGMASGTTVEILDTGSTLTLDTAAAAALTVDVQANRTTGITISDAATVVLKGTKTGTNDFSGVALDTVDTTSLTVNGGGVANAVLTTGAITASNALATLAVNTTVDTATVGIASLVDADGLTSLTVTADYGDVGIGDIGSNATANNAELLATVSLTATSGADITMAGTIFGDTTVDSTTDLAMALTASAGTGSTIALGTVNNLYGAITAVLSGAGTINSTALTADDVTLTVANTGTHAAITATDDIVINASNTGALVFSSLTAGAASTGAITVTGTGTGALTISDVNASAGALSVIDSTATGVVTVLAGDWTGTSTITGGSNNDVLTGGSGNDSITGNDGDDAITAGAGADTLTGGAGNDTYTFGTNWTSADSVVDSAGTEDALSATLSGSVTPTAMAGIETVTLTMNSAAVNGSNITGTTTLNISDSVVDGTALFTNLASDVVQINQTTDLGTVSIGYGAGAAATVRYDFDDLTEAATNLSTTFTNVAKLTVDADETAANDVNLTSLTATTMTDLTLAGGAGDLLTGAISAAALVNLTTTNSSTGAVQTGTIAADNALKTVSITSSSTGQVGLGIINANAGAAATAMTSYTVSTGANTVANTFGLLDLGTDGTLSSYSITAGASTAANTYGGVTALTLGSISITTGDGSGSHTFNTFAGITGALGNVTIDADDNVTFTTGATAATSVGNINVTTIAGATVALGTMGKAGATSIGDITHTGGGIFSMTAGTAVAIGEVNSSGATGTTTVVLTDTTTIGTHMTGGDGVDNFTGTGGNDTMIGGAGIDSLTGGAGNDTMTGGTGVDTFAVNAGTDTITDLGVGGVDVLVVSGGATAVATAGAAWTAGAGTLQGGTASILAHGFAIDVSGAGSVGSWTLRNDSTTTTSLTGDSGNDAFVVVGTIDSTQAAAYALAGSGIVGANLAGVLAFTELTSVKTVSDAVTGSITGGGGTDTLDVYGTANLSGMTISGGVGAAVVHSSVTFTSAQVDAFTSITFDGNTPHTLTITDGAGVALSAALQNAALATTTTIFTDTGAASNLVLGGSTLVTAGTLGVVAGTNTVADDIAVAAAAEVADATFAAATVTGSSGVDYLYGNVSGTSSIAEDDTYVGLAGNDYLGGSQRSNLDGVGVGEISESSSNSADADLMFGGAVSVATGGVYAQSVDTTSGGTTNTNFDTIWGTYATDHVAIFSGANIYEGRGGNDILVATDMKDVFFYKDYQNSVLATNKLTASLFIGTDTIHGFTVGTDLIAGLFSTGAGGVDSDYSFLGLAAAVTDYNADLGASQEALLASTNGWSWLSTGTGTGTLSFNSDAMTAGNDAGTEGDFTINFVGLVGTVVDANSFFSSAVHA